MTELDDLIWQATVDAAAASAPHDHVITDENEMARVIALLLVGQRSLARFVTYTTS